MLTVWFRLYEDSSDYTLYDTEYIHWTFWDRFDKHSWLLLPDMKIKRRRSVEVIDMGGSNPSPSKLIETFFFKLAMKI
jgi:hypothetical protein